MHQDGREGVRKPLLRPRKSALTSVVSKVLNFSNQKKWEIWRKMPNLLYRVRHQRAGRWIFLWARPMHQGGRNGATKPPLRARKDALTSVVSKVRNFSNKKNWGKFGEKCPIYKTEFRIDVPSEYFFSGLGQCTKTGAGA